MISDLIARIDSAVQLGDPAAITGRIKRELEGAIQARRVALPDRFLKEGYASTEHLRSIRSDVEVIWNETK